MGNRYALSGAAQIPSWVTGRRHDASGNATGTPAATRVPAPETSSAHTPGIPMSTIVPRLAAAIRLAGVHPAAAAAGTPAQTPGGTALLLLILAVAFVVVVIRINGQLVSLVSQLLQLATAVGLSLLMIIMICALVIVIMLHG